METINYKGIEILKEQPTKENPYIVADYPYGFRSRTSIRYWVDTTKYGQRFASQTKNPKTGLWNKEKYGTYSKIVMIGLDIDNHITYITIDSDYSSLEEVKPTIDQLNPVFSEYQKKEAIGIMSILKVYENVKFNVVETTNWTEEQLKKHQEEQRQANILVNKAIVSDMVHSGLKIDEAIKKLK